MGFKGEILPNTTGFHWSLHPIPYPHPFLRNGGRNRHNSVNVRPSTSICIPACSVEQGASYGVMLVCVNVISGAPEEEYQILSKFDILFVRTNVSGRR